MYITIDGKKAAFTAQDGNIVEVAENAGIGIPAPCYRSKKSSGCCKACVIEIDGDQVYACSTKPVEGMNVAVKRDDLKFLRTERLKKYRESPGRECDCDCSIKGDPRASCC